MGEIVATVGIEDFGNFKDHIDECFLMFLKCTVISISELVSPV